MSENLSIVFDEYDQCTKNIKNANNRSEKNNSNYKTKISSTDLPCAITYKNTIENIKETLRLYKVLMEEDLGKLVTIRENFKNADK